MKPFKTKRNEYKPEDIIETSNTDAIKPLLEQEAILPIRKAFEIQYKAFSKWLLRYPLNVQDLKAYKPELYDKLMSLYNTIDKYCLKWDYNAFIEAIDAYKDEKNKAGVKAK